MDKKTHYKERVDIILVLIDPVHGQGLANGEQPKEVDVSDVEENKGESTKITLNS